MTKTELLNSLSVDAIIEEYLEACEFVDIEIVKAEGLGRAVDILKYERDKLQEDALRWRFYADSSQTALYLGTKLDPNDEQMDWKSECDKLAGKMMTKMKTIDEFEDYGNH